MKKIAVFASGNGGNFEAITVASQKSELGNCKVVLCVCDNPGAKVCERAARLGVETFSFKPSKYNSKTEYETQIADLLDKKGVDLVCLAGYMRIVGKTLLERYDGRIINIHPALLPSFPGAHGIKDAFDYGVKVYGVTIHYVDAGVDTGKIIAQEAFNYEGNDIEELEDKIHEIEHPLYVRTIRSLLKNSQEKDNRNESIN